MASETADGARAWCEYSEVPAGWVAVEGLELKGKKGGKTKNGTIAYDEDGRPEGAKKAPSLLRLRVRYLLLLDVGEGLEKDAALVRHIIG